MRPNRAGTCRSPHDGLRVGITKHQNAMTQLLPLPGAQEARHIEGDLPAADQCEVEVTIGITGDKVAA